MLDRVASKIQYQLNYAKRFVAQLALSCVSNKNIQVSTPPSVIITIKLSKKYKFNLF